MRSVVRANTRAVAAVLSAIALALVFAAVFRAVPAGPVPRIEPLLGLIPHLNAAVSAAAIVTITLGVRNIRAGNIAAHRRLMLLSTLLFATFLVLYLYKIVLAGTTVFTGPEAVKQFLYLPLLGIHVMLAIVAVPLVVYVLLLAWTRSVAELPRTPHPRYGRLAAGFWLISFVLGILVYLLLYVVY